MRELLSNNSLSVRCKQINHSHFALVIWSLQLTSSELLLYNSLLELIYFLNSLRHDCSCIMLHCTHRIQVIMYERIIVFLYKCTGKAIAFTIVWCLCHMKLVFRSLYLLNPCMDPVDTFNNVRHWTKISKYYPDAPQWPWGQGQTLQFYFTSFLDGSSWSSV